MEFNLQYKPFGSKAVLIEWPQEISELILADIINFKLKIESENILNLQELITGFCSLTLVFSSEINNNSLLIKNLKLIYLKVIKSNNYESKLWHMPVCYDLDFGLDLQLLSEEKKLSITDVIRLHSEAIYKVYFIGFLPGFLYLGGLNKKLHTNRKDNPRLKVNKGSVAIGGEQTGIYPNESAGGWNIIGKTPIPFFDINNQKPCFAQSGDNIQFVPISKFEYFELESKIASNSFQLKPIEND